MAAALAATAQAVLIGSAAGALLIGADRLIGWLTLASRNRQNLGAWRCTRCNRDEVDARANGCPRAPCPMVPK